jgi:hypothetical protein
MMYYHNNGKHIDDIVGRTECGHHNAPKGTPCFYLYYDKASLNRGSAVCGERIRKAGFVGKISPNSLSHRAKKARFGS